MSSTCHATWYARGGSARAGNQCDRPEHKRTPTGVPLCWVHWVTYEAGRATVAELLAGRRLPAREARSAL